jgi:hypothetical protein
LSNVIAVVVAHLLDPAQTLRDAQRSLEDELQWQLADHLRQNAAQVASGAVPEAAAHKQAEMVAGFLASTRGKNGQKPAAAPMRSTAPVAAPTVESLSDRFMDRWARGDDDMDPDGMDTQVLSELFSAFEYVKRKPSNQWTENDQVISRWAKEVRTAQRKSKKS